MLARFTSVLAMAAVLAVSCGDRQTSTSPRPPPTPSQPRILGLSDLIASGKLRVAFNSQNITCIAFSPGGINGPCVDIARELAAQMHVQMDDREYGTLDRVFDAGRGGEWDVAFMVVDQNQPGIVFTAPYLEIDQTYLVAGDSPFRSVTDLDRPDVRITAFSPSVIERYLRANLKNARLVAVSSLTEAARLIETGRADAYAGARTELLTGQWRLPNGRILDDAITRNEWAIAVAAGRPDLLAYVSRFVEDAKNTGVILDAINRNKLEGARVVR